jgi:hypothetical protein
VAGAPRYVWHHRPEDDFPPPSVTHPEGWTPAERLNLVCTQTDLPASRQRRLVAAWCDLLPTLEGVRYLWLNSRTPQALFDAACAMPNLEALYVKWSAVTSIERIAGTDLRHFHLGSSSRLESIEPLTSMHALRWLGLENVKKIRDIGPLGGLGDLEGLFLEGSMWTTQRVETLEPIGRLTGLRFLALANLRADDGTLEPLFSLTNLERLSLAEWWPVEQVREIERRNPGLA